MSYKGKLPISLNWQTLVHTYITGTIQNTRRDLMEKVKEHQ